MYKVSDRYKQYVYNKPPYEDIARHFLPEALVKIIDVAARDAGTYTATTEAFYTAYEQLVDDVPQHRAGLGSLEDYQFVLNGKLALMPDSVAEIQSLQVGWSSEEMSNENCTFDNPVVLVCSYNTQVSTVGRTLFFADTYDSYPVDLNLVYCRNGLEIAREEIRGNEHYMVTGKVDVMRYDQLFIEILKVSKPHRRVRLLEDIPGIYLTYKGNDIVSLNITQSVDIFSESITVGEIDLTVQNVTKDLDILNEKGKERYLQRRQPIEVRLNLVYPDDTYESVLIGLWELSTWKSNKGAIDASFTIHDPIDKLAQGEYIKGTLPTLPVSMYEMAKAVLDDAGIKEYTIDQQLINVYSRACLPIAEHKELLRMIAQASQAVVLPTPTGGIHIKYISPLIYGNNTLSDGAFDGGGTKEYWTLTNAARTNKYLYTGSNSVLLGENAVVSQDCPKIEDKNGDIHKLYICCYFMPSKALDGQTGVCGIYTNDDLISVNIVEANLNPMEWTRISSMRTSNDAFTFKVKSTLEKDIVYLDAAMICDLTILYGKGNEPSQEWCDTNIRFIRNTMMIPRYRDPAPVDSLDYNILLDAPEIGTSEPVKAVETAIYNNEIEGAVSEVYKGSRIVNGTETFDVRYNTLATGCSVEAKILDEAGNPGAAATVVKSVFYGYAATLTIQANSGVQIIIKGKKVNQNKSTYAVNADIEPALVPDALTKVINNELITYRAVAENVTSFAVYWYGRRYQYDFDWRQNPAVEVLDTVTVFDDFNNNNGVYLTDRELDYNNGILLGNAKGVF